MASLTKTPLILCKFLRFMTINRRAVYRITGTFPLETQAPETDIPLKVLFDPTLTIHHVKMYLNEWKEYLIRPRWYPMVQHEDVHMEWKFDDPEVYQNWMLMADSDFKKGYSKCELLMSKQKTAIFRGNIDTTVPKDGRTAFAGFCTMKSKRLHKAFFRNATYNDWARFTHFMIKFRGDGRKYHLLLHTPGPMDVYWHDYYTYPLYTHGGPYWQYAQIPFSKFFKACHARIQDRQEPVIFPFRNVGDFFTMISSMGISLYDKIDGPFCMEIAWIGVYKDVTHKEEFAYESYKLPFRY